MRPKTCPICKGKFVRTRAIQPCCSKYECQVSYAKQVIEKKNRKELKERKAKLKKRSEYIKDAQTVFNKYIRLRDNFLPCISCGRHHSGQYHAGHYRSTKAAPELRFHPLNNHKQCQPCNNHLSGNIVEYRKRLIEKIGIDNVEWLEGPHEPKKYTIEDLIAIKKEYQRKIKEIENAKN